MSEDYSTIDIKNCEDYTLEFRIGKYKKLYPIVKTGERSFMIKSYDELSSVASQCKKSLEYFSTFAKMYVSEFPDVVCEETNKPTYFYEKTIKKLISRLNMRKSQLESSVTCENSLLLSPCLSPKILETIPIQSILTKANQENSYFKQFAGNNKESQNFNDSTGTTTFNDICETVENSQSEKSIGDESPAYSHSNTLSYNDMFGKSLYSISELGTLENESCCDENIASFKSIICPKSSKRLLR